MAKSLSAGIVVDPYPRSSFDWRACFKVRVTSQNGPQSLVSKKCDLAVSKASGPAFIVLTSLYYRSDFAPPLRQSKASLVLSHWEVA
jgi:hypothetical protein